MAENKQELAHILRIANSDIVGTKQLYIGLRKIKGISFMFSNLICTVSGIDPTKKIGYLNAKEIEKIESILNDPLKFGVPVWMLNRRKDYETGDMKHIISSDLTFVQQNDIKVQRKIKSYKGIRHSSGLPVRGQRTKSNFRKNKGKVHLGVRKKAGSKAGRV
ncbi:MAG: 30S ribosomal protein S13 [Nanoarchaeota archaeon]